MSTPSLLNVPYRLKAGTLYSQIPETGLGDFAVTRVTSPTTNRSTRVNSLGFIELVNDGVPRLDYPLGGAVNGCPALLVEPSAINLVPNGLGYNAVAGVVYDTTITDSPAIGINSTRINKSVGVGNLRYANQECSNSVLSGNTSYAISRFFKYDGVDFQTTMEANSSAQFGGVSWIQRINIASTGITLGTSTACTGSIQNYGNGWYRVSAIITTGASPSGSPVQYLMALPAALSAGQGMLTALPQLETGSVATSYIHTNSAAITRGADLVSKTGVSSLIGQTEGTIYLEVDAPSASSQFFRIRSGVANAIHVYKNASDRYQVRIYPSASNIDLTDTSARSGFVKIAIAYKSGESALVINGGTPITSTVAYSFSAALDSVNFLGGVEPVTPTRIRASALYPTRLSNTDLALLTA